MRNASQILITLAAVIILVLLVITISTLLPSFLGKTPTNTRLQEATATPTQPPYPAPASSTPPPALENTSIPTSQPSATITKTNTPTPGVEPTFTPLPLPTIAADASGEILFIDVTEKKKTNLKKVLVSKEVQLEQVLPILTDPLPPEQEYFGGLGDLFPSPDGKHLLIDRNSEGPDFLLVDASSGKADAPFNDSDFIAFLDWYPDSKHLLFWQHEGLWLVDLKGKKQVELVHSERIKGGIASAAASPDGQNIIYSFVPANSHVSEVYMVSSNGGDNRKLFEQPGTVSELTWSPDGSKIAFYNGNYWVMDADCKNQRKLLPGRMRRRSSLKPLWSPDSQILITDNSGITLGGTSEYDKSNIFVIDVQSGDNRPLLQDGSDGHLYPAWSPDGDKISFISTKSGTTEIWVVNRDGSGLHRLTSAGRNIRFLLWRK